MGLIHYNDPAPVTSDEQKKGAKIASFLRKHLGGALLFTWLYSLLFVLEKYYEVKLPVGLFFFALILIYIYIYNDCYKK